MSRRLLSVVSLTLLALLAASSAQAAPPWLERYRQYRVVDASGRIAPRPVGVAGDRVVMRPAGPVPFLFRSRPYNLAGYAGAVYPDRMLAPTSHHVLTHGHGLGTYGPR